MDALNDVVDEDRPHSDEAFSRYLEWYVPRTRVRVTHVPLEARVDPPELTDTYPVARDQNFGLAVCI